MDKDTDAEKVYFRGESMWVEVESRAQDGKHLMGTVANYPLNASVHQYRYGDDVAAHLVEYPEHGFQSWEPVHAVNPHPTNNPESDLTIEEVFEKADPIKEQL